MPDPREGFEITTDPRQGFSIVVDPIGERTTLEDIRREYRYVRTGLPQWTGIGEIPVEEPIRYIPPAIIAARRGSPLAVATTAAISEVAADELGQWFEGNPLLDGIERHAWNALGGAVSGMTEYIGMRWAEPAIMKLIKQGIVKGGRLVHMVPNELAPDREIAYEFLNATSPSADELYAPTLGQLLDETQSNWVSFLESTARSGLGSKGAMAKYDLRTKKHLQKIMEDFVDFAVDRSTEPIVVGQILRDLHRGETNFIHLTRGIFYSKLRKVADAANIVVDLPELRTLFKERVRDPEIMKIYRYLGTRVPKLADKVADEWKNISVGKVLKIRRRLNAFKPADRMEESARNEVAEIVRNQLRTATSQHPDAKAAFEIADRYTKATGDRFIKQELIQALGKKLNKTPSVVLREFKMARNRVDVFNALENAFLRTGIEGVPGKLTTLSQEQFDEAILRPLRWSILSDAYDITKKSFDGAKLRSIFDKIESESGRTFLERIWGGREQYDWIRRWATASNLAQEAKFGEKVYIQLAQGGAILSALGAATSGVINPVAAGAGGLLLFVSPMALAKMLTNTPLTKILVEGLSAGPHSTAFTRMVTAVAIQNAASRIDRRRLANSPDAAEFYSSMLPEKGLFGEATLPTPIEEIAAARPAPPTLTEREVQF